MAMALLREACGAADLVVRTDSANGIHDSSCAARCGFIWLSSLACHRQAGVYRSLRTLRDRYPVTCLARSHDRNGSNAALPPTSS